MIRALVFDLDGTLVQTEPLKGVSYARAALELRPGAFSEEDIAGAFKELVGRSRRAVAQALLERFALKDSAAKLLDQYQVSEPWQAFVQVRLKHYNTMLADPRIVADALCPYNAALLRSAREQGFQTALCTMSHAPQVARVLDILELKNSFDFVATIDDVENGKPDPEIYLLSAAQLGQAPSNCLAIEDSVSGIKAALAAGCACIAVTSDYTREAVHASGVIDAQWIVDDLTKLEAVAAPLLTEGEY